LLEQTDQLVIGNQGARVYQIDGGGVKGEVTPAQEIVLVARGGMDSTAWTGATPGS
jgi:hypothetical protein